MVCRKPKIRPVIGLLLICSAGFWLIYPTLHNNLETPNLIPYFNGDEGYLMDVIWSYFSGEVRPSFVGSVDYGLQLLYISDFCRLIFSHFFDFTPGTFVLILRWFHLLSWIGCIIALWRLVGRHFGKGWPQLLCVALLASRPSLAYYTASSKPDFLVLFFMILGLDYTLRLIDSAKTKNLILAVSCAALAVIVKFGGFFLLPAIVAALFFRERYYLSNPASTSPLVPGTKGARHQIRSVFLKAVTAPVILCSLLALAPIIGLFSYTRETSGLTYIQEFGFLQSLLKLKIILVLWGGVAILLAAYLFFFVFYKSRSPFWTRIQNIAHELSSHAFTVVGAFTIAMLIFGFRWILKPGHLIHTYLRNGMGFSGGYILKEAQSLSSVLSHYWTTISDRFIGFDLGIIILFGLYLALEIYIYRKNIPVDKRTQFKRFTLLIYLIPFLMAMFSLGRFTHHHALPFFVAVCILIAQGIKLMMDHLTVKPATVLALLLVTDISWFGWKTIDARIYQRHQRQDIAYELSDWLNKHTHRDDVIIADHPTRTYVPSEHANVTIFKGYLPNRIEQLKKLIQSTHPRYVYYNVGASGSQGIPDLRTLLPQKQIKVLKVFDSRKKPYQRLPGDQVVLYELEQRY